MVSPGFAEEQQDIVDRRCKVRRGDMHRGQRSSLWGPLTLVRLQKRYIRQSFSNTKIKRSEECRDSKE